MIIFRVLYGIRSIIRLFFLKIIYGQTLVIKGKVNFRKGFTLLIYKSGFLEIGENCFFNNYCSIVVMNSIQIGDNTIFGENVKIYDHNHKFSDPHINIRDQGYTNAPIVIGSNCWIGSNVIILKGVKIGNNSVIGAGCIVYKDVPENTLLLCKQDQEVKRS